MPITKASALANGATHSSTIGNARTLRAPPARRREDALAVLVADHARIAQLFERFDGLESSGPRKASIVLRLCDEIDVHSRIEEEIFYPSVRAAFVRDDVVDAAAVEHETARAMTGQLRLLRPDDLHYDAKVRVLGEYVRHHVEVEEDAIFPHALAMDADLVALGRALKARRRQLHLAGGGRRRFALIACPGSAGA